MMSSSSVEHADLLDLKLLPAWVKEPDGTKSYKHYTGEEERKGSRTRQHPSHRPGDRHGRRGKSGLQPPTPNGKNVDPRQREKVRPEQAYDDRSQMRARQRKDRREDRRAPGWQRRHAPVMRAPLEITIRFMPYSMALENVVAQIKSDSLAYSVFALARLFLEKPERYEVRLTAKPESPLFQLGENGTCSADRESLEQDAFRLVREDFYQIDVTQSDPVKGNFSNVARCRLSGTLLGPTNHHNYQPQLRSLYEQRFSRRMGFADYLRQVEIVNDPELIERWKEEAQTVTTYTTLREETPLTFASPTEAERHFRSNYLARIIRSVEEVTLGGVLSRQLPDRQLNRAIEDAWTVEMRSPSNMMRELAGRFRQAGLNVFRHRRGMLFVLPIQVRPFAYEQAGVSPTVNAILNVLAAMPGITRKDLSEKVITGATGEEAELRRLALASDLRWLINEGYVIEFNDGSLDLPRMKAKPKEPVAGAVSTAELMGEAIATANTSAAYSPTTLNDGVESPSS
jgi:hypothetical protein